MKISSITPLFLLAAAALSPLLEAKPFSQKTVRSTSNQIDQLVADYLQKKNIKANPVIDDATFARRSFITITGRIPTAEEARAFIHDTQSDKRRTLVDTLIHSKGYESRMFNFWANLLRLKTNHEKYGLGWHTWIRNAVANNTPYDQFVHAMISADGMSAENPAVGYYLRDRGMLLDNISNTAQIFLGTQIGCAQCHDHPFEDITQRQYYEFAAFAGGTEYRSSAAKEKVKAMTSHTLKEKGTQLSNRLNTKKRTQKQRGAARKTARDYASLFRDFHKNAITDSPHKKLQLPHDYQYNDGEPGEVVEPKTFFGASVSNVPPADRRQAFADWISNRHNPYFTKVIVNRLWAEVFGRGIVEPADDWSETTNVSHPELIDYLCQVMIATDYDIQQFMRVLYHTRLFESAVAPEEAAMGRSYDFRGPILRRMSAEEIHDSFIALEFGNRDNTVNKNIKTQWDTYTQNVKNLFKLQPAQLIALDTATDDAEKKFYADRIAARKLRQELEKARGEGDQEKAQKLQLQLRKQYTSLKRKSQKQNNDAQGNEENMMMNMVMQRNLRTRGNQSMRSSEQPAPFKPSSFMRQFGASDRETPDGSHTQASIPQVLTLLNGREVTSMTDGKGLLARNLRKTNNPSERLDTLFLSIYGNLPNASERKRYQTMMQSPTNIQTLAKAMLNSKRFLFVQ
ncbi:MAG: DUF1549 and DUF1553 domain-containing protein [Verrucomicrobiae bacterium]|nr:DUF1549 and DUF1553 domain-containing protein [Verrucomicrobiae bacterium]NNJ43951.1 DUF1549 domain-containing protein [Akkermansiaceae bacterium]